MEITEQHATSRGISVRKFVITVVCVIIITAGLCVAIAVPIFHSNRSSDIHDGVNVASTHTPVTSTHVPATSSHLAETLVHINCGHVKGERHDGVHVFKGIPYATPPTGRLRWKPPVPLSPEHTNCWEGTLNADSFGNSCFQTTFESRRRFRGDEDCLYLNVWTPSLDKFAQLPVLVMIHGGSLEYLSGNDPDTSPTPTLAAETQAVYVSMNYRLNVFGFLALDILTSASATGTSGNYGFMDQLLALRWVQENIRHFGGNPALVTVFGQSSGGTSILALLASPLSAGLFHRAWMMSASPVLNRTLSEASTDNLAFLNNTGCLDIDCLYNQSAEDLALSITWDEWPRWSMAELLEIPTRGQFNGALAIIDGYVLEEEPLVKLRTGRGMNVPVIIGTTAQETDLSPPVTDVRTWAWNDYTDYVMDKLTLFGSDIANKAVELYPPLLNVTPEYQLTSLISDIRVTCPNHVLANAMAVSSNMRVYRYIVTSHPARPIHAYGNLFASAYAFHSWDGIVFFGGLKTYFPEPSKKNLDFKRNQQTEMVFFARNGFPYSLNWHPYPNTTALLSHDVNTVQAYHSQECQYWIDKGFFSYGWIN